MESNTEPIEISNSEVKEGNNTNNPPQEEIKESISLSEAENNKKKIEIQETNINGNYGRIIIQENNKESSPSQREEKIIIKKIITIDDNNKAKINNRRYKNDSIDNKYIIKKDDNNKKNKKSNLRRKSIDRGGDYKNVQVTHIIYSINDELNFHIIDPLMISTDEGRQKLKKKIDKNNRNGRNGGVKVSYNCSCDKVKIAPSNKKNLIGQTQVVTHRQNNLRVINNKNNNNDNDKDSRYKNIKGNKEKDSIIIMNYRNKNNENNKVNNTGKGNAASYKKRNEKK